MKSDKVLMIGYGRIGKIKSLIWRSLGLEAVIYDTDALAALSAYEDNFTMYHPFSSMSGDYMLDISTPAGQHFKALEWAITHGASVPRAVIMEKPLASTLNEVSAFEEFTQTTPGSRLAGKIFVNESYYSSTALVQVRDSIREHGEYIESLDIELSKNRLSDNDRGRFFDAALGVLGIEVPHMVAMLQVFGVSPELLTAGNATLLIDQMRPDSQAFLLHHHSTGVEIRLSSYLGDFRFQHGRLVKNEGVVRELTVTTNKRRYRLAFDPVATLPRYHTHLHILPPASNGKPEMIVDDHLRKHMSLCATNQRSALTEFCGLKNALRIAKILIEIRQKCDVRLVGRTRLPVVSPYRSTKGGL